jgi:hypothetical protein
MPVLLVLQTTQKAPYYPPFKSAIDRLGATRILKAAWRFDNATLGQVLQAVNIHLPNSDGYVVAEVSEMERRPVFKT